MKEYGNQLSCTPYFIYTFVQYFNSSSDLIHTHLCLKTYRIS